MISKYDFRLVSYWDFRETGLRFAYIIALASSDIKYLLVNEIKLRRLKKSRGEWGQWAAGWQRGDGHGLVLPRIALTWVPDGKEIRA